MPAFNAFPFDVLFEICTNLDIEDTVHLSLTCQHLRALLLTHTVAHRIVETRHRYSEEARQARQGSITYGAALCAIYDRRHSFSKAQPFSARIVGQGNTFLYRQGVLCVQENDTVVVSNLRTDIPAVHINLSCVFAAADLGSPGDTYEMMYYSDGILAVHVTNEEWHDMNESLIKFLKTSDVLHDSERFLAVVPLNVDTSRLFVRHTAQYFCFGTHTGTGNDGHRKWEIRCSNYDYEVCEEPSQVLLLEDFHGNDIRSTVAFEVHDGYFYAVSNQGTYEVEEVDWTSFYHCVRFPLDDPAEDTLQQDKKVFRRQHREGAIHDSWTDLTLQPDERTNDLLIVESRREWVGASSRQARTFYTSCINFTKTTNISLDSGLHDKDDVPRPPVPENDILTSLLGSSHNANYMPTPKQYSWTRHPEIPFKTCQIPSPRTFILARTKFRAYNSSCSAFVDLVEDDQCCLNRPPTASPCFKLRIGSRRIAPNAPDPFENDCESTQSKALITPQTTSSGHVSFEDDTQYHYTPIRMWPPAGTQCPCSTRLHHIMNADVQSPLSTGSGPKTISAVCDERSIVYMVKPKHAYRTTGSGGVGHVPGTIVLVDFGRTSTSAVRPADGRWEWLPSQQRRCREGTC
ncbi:hypothetical protein OPT61_g4402 [Boeremia exigua]|uniref:Uncharacterized protein n=1 Tax=Boeremia exigua TaxID=749465 RepID=A0ACC2IEE8_9PLEO|nr:hypothetical protein OPT61_g4402 [Boeremia exigua]